MSLLDLIAEQDVWEKFYEYKLSLACPKRFTKELRRFIDEKRYLPVYENVLSGGVFPLPQRSVLVKAGTDKKRVVYTYPQDENTVLKLLTWLMLRKYDNVFERGLYSFRPVRTAKDAVRGLLKNKAVMRMYSYKVDIHDYFNSVPVGRLLPVLEKVLSDDGRLFAFLSSLLCEPCVIDRGKTVEERKGIMAGTPLSAFYANLYLCGLDRHFADLGAVYARYSDDMIVFSESKEQISEYAEYIRAYLTDNGLDVNPKKECCGEPGDGFVFLGFLCRENEVDVAPITVKKLKDKMRRKRDALARWRKRNDADPEKAAKAFIRVFNRKLLESPRDNELSWSSWFFPVINTEKSLHEIDLYAQDCLRYLISGKHTKARYNVRYEDLKALGYRSLVNAYYAFDGEKTKR